jgi:hypothetical protein
MNFPKINIRLIGVALFQNLRLLSKPTTVCLHNYVLFMYLYQLIFILHFSCVIRGCVPKKILVYGSPFRGEFEVYLQVLLEHVELNLK